MAADEVVAGGCNVAHLQQRGCIKHVEDSAAAHQPLGGVDEVEDLLQALGGEGIQGQVYTPQLFTLGKQGMEEWAIGCQHSLVGRKGAALAHQDNVHVTEVGLEEALLVQPVHQTGKVQGHILYKRKLSRRDVCCLLHYELKKGERKKMKKEKEKKKG